MLLAPVGFSINEVPVGIPQAPFAKAVVAAQFQLTCCRVTQMLFALDGWYMRNIWNCWFVATEERFVPERPTAGRSGGEGNTPF